MIDYSICIRTLGRGGEKYSRLLKSIELLNPKPKEVIVVIPHGFSIPKEQLGYEKYIFSEKGMLTQRIVGYENANTEYVLLVDDDIEFKEDLVKKLYLSIEKNNADISFPIYEDLLPKGLKAKLATTLNCSCLPSLNRKKYNKILNSGGFTYPLNLNRCNKELESESAPGMCILAKRRILMNIKLRNELWVEVPEYALKEDAVLAYKAYLNGYKIIGVRNINIIHLDNASSDSTRRLKAIYAIGFNQIIFFKKFILLYERIYIKKLIKIICIGYWIISNILLGLIKGIYRFSFEEINTFINGINDGIKYEI